MMPLDPEVVEALRSRASQPPFERLSVEAARTLAAQRLATSPSSSVQVTERPIPCSEGDRRARVYTPTGDTAYPVLMFFHGGGFVLGDLDTHDAMCRALCVGASCMVCSLDYRLAPEAKYPAASDDCLAATRWVGDHAHEICGEASRLAVGGDSAGGNLAAVTALRIRDEGGPALAGQLLIYPVLDYYEPATPSYLENGTGVGMTRETMIWFWDHYLTGPEAAHNAYAAPLRAGDLSGLPPALIVTAEYDPLRDEGEAYAERLRDAGVPTILTRYDGMVHGFFSMAETVRAGRDGLADASAWLARTLGEA